MTTGRVFRQGAEKLRGFHMSLPGRTLGVQLTPSVRPRVRPERKQDALVETAWTRVLQRGLVGNRFPDYATWDVSCELQECTMPRNLAIGVLSLCIFAAAALAADDPFIGTWKANMSKSAFSPGPPPTSVTVTIAPNGTNGIKVTVEAMNAKGEKTVNQYSANYDGKEYPFVQTGAGAVSGQTVSLKRMDSHTVERITYL